MKLSVLDVYILSMLDRGAQSGYDLQRQAGISLGASTPSLRKLLKEHKLVSRQVGKSATNHRRFSYLLTPAAKDALIEELKSLLAEQDRTTDLDSILRIVDMASHYGADPETIKSFLTRAGEKRSLMAKQAALEAKAIRSNAKMSYSKMRSQCDETRLLAEGKALLLIANVFKRPKGVPEGQQSVFGSKVPLAQ